MNDNRKAALASQKTTSVKDTCVDVKLYHPHKQKMSLTTRYEMFSRREVRKTWLTKKVKRQIGKNWDSRWGKENEKEKLRGNIDKNIKRLSLIEKKDESKYLKKKQLENGLEKSGLKRSEKEVSFEFIRRKIM